MVRQGQAEEYFYNYIIENLNGKNIPTMSEALTKRFNQSLLEIFSNAGIHAKSELGIFVCGQYYPNKNRVDFTISDAGIGFLENVRKYTNNNKISSCDAIKWGLTEGNTTKSGKEPGGLGLKLLNNFIKK